MAVRTYEPLIPAEQYDIHEVMGSVAMSSIEEVNEYHLRQPIAGILQYPLSPDFMREHLRHAELFTHNRSMYSPEIEEIIAEDVVIQALKDLRKGNVGGQEYVNALRSRRTTLAALAIARSQN